MASHVACLRRAIAVWGGSECTGLAFRLARNYNKMSRRDRVRWRNIIAAIVFAAVWVCLFLLPQAVGSISLTPTLRLAVLPLLVGIGFASALSGAWSERLPYVLGMPALPMLFLGAYFSVGADPEGGAFVWMLVGMPLLPYLIGAGVTVAMIEFTKGPRPNKQ